MCTCPYEGSWKLPEKVLHEFISQMFFYEDEHSPLLIQGSRRKLQIFPEYNDIDPSECNDALFFIVP